MKGPRYLNLPDLMNAEEKKLALERFIDQAQQYLRGEKFAFEEISNCANELFDARKFSYARRLLARLHQEYTLQTELYARWAISTCKDDDQPGETRFDQAIQILTNKFGSDPAKTKISRIAGNLGSIYRQKWRFDNQEHCLKTALCYLNHGYELWLSDWKDAEPALPDGSGQEIPADSNFFDQGYCAINAAYVCDTLAARQREISREDPMLKAFADQLTERSRKIRMDIVRFCESTESYYQKKWTRNAAGNSRNWFYTTWVEALMGLGPERCKEALLKLQDAINLQYFDLDSWSGDSSAQQIAFWIEEDHFLGDAQYRAYANELMEKISGAPAFGSRNKRIGIALSGGGFRASLFHIGVLARLAEQDLLRSIEVISCVSGGSIIGAYYYLKVRNLLQSLPDSEITREHYVKIVQEIEHEFLEDISTDLRSNLFRNFWGDLRIAFDPDYSRTSRLADRYEEKLYARLLDKKAEAERFPKRDSNGKVVPEVIDPIIYMTDLMIRPMDKSGELTQVSPKKVNWKRQNKLPMLVLNATTLNTGHCWQFTATWMGEPPGYINNETDALPTLRRMYYEEAPTPHQKIRLATAVAASSCVPGLFKPVQLRKLYLPDSGKMIDVELVDGGVYDNQGINTLLEQECSVFIISDASGQLASVDDPGSSPFSVGGRTNAILQERIRACQLQDLSARFDSKVLQGYLLMHLTKGLPSEVVNWRDCDDPYEPNFAVIDENGQEVLTAYGIRKNIQQALARIRTDLDSFHDKEAYALMLSGYQMTDFEIAQGEGSGKMQQGARIQDPVFAFRGDSNRPSAQKPNWKFNLIREIHKDPAEQNFLQELLDVSSRMLKVHLVSPWVKWSIRGLGILACSSLIYALGAFLDWNIQQVVIAILAILGAGGIGYLSYQIVFKRLRFNPLISVVGFGLSIFVSLLTWIFAKGLNAAYLNAGKLPSKEPGKETENKP
jgi:predicted acylesterase/phospholipase RssA